MDHKYMDWETHRLRRTALRGSACRADTEALSGLILWICSDGVGGKACVAMETLTDGALVLTESWAGLWNNISCFISLPLSSSCPFLSFHLSNVSLFVLFYSCSLWHSRNFVFLIWLQHFMARPLLSSAVLIISTISFSTSIRVSLVYLLWSIICVCDRLKCLRDKSVESSG